VTARVLLALLIGLALGIGAAAVGGQPLAVALEPVGTLWTNAIRMTVIPLVVALVITGVAEHADLRRIGRMGGLAAPVFVGLLLAGGLFTLVVAPLSLDRLDVTAAAAESLRAGAASTADSPPMPSLAQRLVETIPANPIKAAADGSMLPVVVFALVFALALTRLEPARREPVVRLFQSVSDTMLTIVGWVLAVAPIGIFALALALGARMGAAAAGALVHYVLTLSAVMLAYTALLYLVAAAFGAVPICRFAAAVAPAQAVAFSSRSSLAALPALIAGARDRLGASPAITGFALPLAVSVFRVNVPLAWVVGALFLGKLYGVEVGLGAMFGLVVTSTLISFSVPGIPSASLFLLAPVLVELGLPAEGAGILIAVDAIPDMFKTTANVTAHMTAAVILTRSERPPILQGSVTTS
jgi:proton glutamate symport protein